MRHDHRLRQALFRGRVGVLAYYDSADRRAAFRAYLDAGRVGAVNLELRPVAIIATAAASQKRFEVGETKLIFSRRETAEAKISLLIRPGGSAESAEWRALVGAFPLDAHYTGARDRLGRLLSDHAGRRFESYVSHV